MLRSTVIGITVALALSATAGYAVQEFTLDEAQTRIERLEARVAALEATIASDSGGTPEALESHTIRGTVSITAVDFSIARSDAGKLDAPCWREQGSATVRIMDEAGDIVGLSNVDLSEGLTVDNGVMIVCQFPWAIDVEDANFYVFEIEGQEGPTFSRAELEAAGWNISLAIGD